MMCLSRGSVARPLIPAACAFWLTFTSANACTADYTIWIQRSSTADPLYRVIIRGKMGFIDQTGKVVVPPKLEYSGYNGGDEFHDGLLEIGVSDGIYANRRGNTVIDKGFYRGWDFSEGLAAAMPKDPRKWGFFYTLGEWAISPRFETYPNGYVDSF